MSTKVNPKSINPYDLSSVARMRRRLEKSQSSSKTGNSRIEAMREVMNNPFDLVANHRGWRLLREK